MLWVPVCVLDRHDSQPPTVSPHLQTHLDGNFAVTALSLGGSTCEAPARHFLEVFVYLKLLAHLRSYTTVPGLIPSFQYEVSS